MGNLDEQFSNYDFDIGVRITLSKRDHHTRSMLYVDTIFIVTSGNGTDQRGPGVEQPFEKTYHRSSVASDGYHTDAGKTPIESP
ncbi:hypothetical protein CA13_66500 [Planctomycetes bacterium CA13]|uniref:Uncharacterized protein n=1 Tax=Novipirellula herctigrandis TaxID=2527986 RepID=A0A5C5ZDC9_9BACT|nr:hypothetical protein CA13_66500 [Planctomycetes bacterium CA13]